MKTSTLPTPCHKIVTEILNYQMEQVKRGKFPETITLTTDQHRRLKNYCDWCQAISYGRGLDYYAGRIYGMTYEPIQFDTPAKPLASALGWP